MRIMSFGQPIGEHATGGAGAYDDIVVLLSGHGQIYAGETAIISESRFRPSAEHRALDSRPVNRRKPRTVDQPNVKTNASTSESRNSISNWRSAMGFGWRTS
jgi:hypothetical protein